MKLSDFDALSFDCYGTLIDWETGIWNALRPWLLRVDLNIDREAALAAFAEAESAAQAATPDKFYPRLLTDLAPEMTKALGETCTPEEADAFGRSVADWPAFPDSGHTLARLKRRYKLVILSNVDVASFCESAKRLETPFDYVFTAQEIGSYKPTPQNFVYMAGRLEKEGIPKEKLLHVAQSLFHDHQEASRQGFATCWIDRREGKSGGATKRVDDAPETDWTFPSMAAFADAVEAE